MDGNKTNGEGLLMKNRYRRLGVLLLCGFHVDCIVLIPFFYEAIEYCFTVLLMRFLIPLHSIRNDSIGG